MSTEIADTSKFATGRIVEPPAGGGGDSGDKKVPRESAIRRDRLQQLMDERGTNARAVSREAGLADTYVYDVLNLRNLNPSVQAMQAIAKVLDTTLAYLTGEADHAGIVNPRMQSLDAMPMIGTAEGGTFRKLRQQDEADYPMVYGPRSKQYPGAKHFALEIDDDSMNARLAGPPITAGMLVHCVDMVDAGLVVESGKLYCIRRTPDAGKTWETLVRRAQVFRDRVELIAESSSTHEKIVVPGTLAVTRSMPWSSAASKSIYAIGLVYAATFSAE